MIDPVWDLIVHESSRDTGHKGRDRTFAEPHLTCHAVSEDYAAQLAEMRARESRSGDLSTSVKETA